MSNALLRSVFSGRVRWAMPHVLVEETPELVVLYVPPGTRGRRPARPFVEDPSQLRTLRWAHVEHVWRRSHALRLLRPGDAHCLYVFWAKDDWAFEGWYVNLQAPFRPHAGRLRHARPRARRRRRARRAVALEGRGPPEARDRARSVHARRGRRDPRRGRAGARRVALPDRLGGMATGPELAASGASG